MKQQLVDILADPVTKGPLEIQAGQLRSESGSVYPVVSGIPRFVKTEDEAQAQTRDTFAYKWKRRDTYEWMLGKTDDALQIAWLLE